LPTRTRHSFGGSGSDRYTDLMRQGIWKPRKQSRKVKTGKREWIGFLYFDNGSRKRLQLFAEDRNTALRLLKDAALSNSATDYSLVG
jgi:hypothetical protein